MRNEITIYYVIGHVMAEMSYSFVDTSHVLNIIIMHIYPNILNT